ncbi:MAG TPA: malonyl-CoA decarboxylase [Casimicrobiaceae bacterium]|nr:malonyl-CoA decarboxylase [Casimicrobiaceae bacterium]
MKNGILEGMLQSIAKGGRALARRSPQKAAADLCALCDVLLSTRGEASGVALAREILAVWNLLGADAREAFLVMLAERFGPDPIRLEAAIAAFRDKPGPRTAGELHAAAESRRQELFRRFNLAPGGTCTLVALRKELLALIDRRPEFDVIEQDLQHLLSSWFNRGFLELRRIDWSTPANVLEKIIRYEAVHTIRDWDDLRRRLEPPDRRCFAFFHPQLVDEPLIFVEIALTSDMPGSIAALLAEDRTPVAPERARTAVFYSISNCQEGLRGISFGNFLIKQVVEDLKRELPKLDTFVTLSPLPGFNRWLREQRGNGLFQEEERSTLTFLERAGWHEDRKRAETLRKTLVAAAATYLVAAKTPSGRPVDPVARFHLGNGARLERINFLGDVSDKGLSQSHGVMVNYLYRLEDIEENHEAFATKGAVVASKAVSKLVRPLEP